MNKIIIIIFLITLNIKVNCQYNYLSNGGFNILKSSYTGVGTLFNDCGEAEVDQCIDWGTRTVKYIATCGTKCGQTTILEHSPDLKAKLCNPFLITHKGNCCIGAGAENFEMIQQNIARKLMPGKYIFSGFVKNDRNDVKQETLSLYFHDDALKFECEDDCNAFLSDDNCYYEFDNEPEFNFEYNYNNDCRNSNGNKSWHQFVYEFDAAFETGINNFAFMYRGGDKNARLYCSNTDFYYSFFDEFFLQRKSCMCTDDYWIENRTIHNETIQANENIRVGYNVENVTPNGNVIFQGTNNVLRAGKSVTIEPGTILSSGADVKVEIANCYFKDNGTMPSVTFLSNAAAYGTANHDIVLGVNNATDYYIEMFNQWGVKIMAKTGQISPDNITKIEPPYDKIPNSQVVTYQLWVYNCVTESSIKNGSITLLKNSINSDNLTSVNLFPNPVENKTKLEIKNLTFLSNIDLIVYNIDGKIVKEYSDIEVIENGVNLDLDISDLVKGNYFLKILNNGIQLKTEKIVKE